MFLHHLALVAAIFCIDLVLVARFRLAHMNALTFVDTLYRFCDLDILVPPFTPSSFFDTMNGLERIAVSSAVPLVPEDTSVSDAHCLYLFPFDN